MKDEPKTNGPEDGCAICGEEEILRCYSDLLRGEMKTPSGQEAGLGDRLKAAESLLKRRTAGQQEQESLRRLDELLEEVRRAAD